MKVKKIYIYKYTVHNLYTSRNEKDASGLTSRRTPYHKNNEVSHNPNNNLIIFYVHWNWKTYMILFLLQAQSINTNHHICSFHNADKSSGGNSKDRVDFCGFCMKYIPLCSTVISVQGIFQNPFYIYISLGKQQVGFWETWSQFDILPR